MKKKILKVENRSSLLGFKTYNFIGDETPTFYCIYTFRVENMNFLELPIPKVITKYHIFL